MAKLRIAAIITLLSAGLNAQLDNSSLLYPNTLDTMRERGVFVKVQNLNFLKNNEYYNPFADGYTLFGIQFNPQLGYQLSKYTSVEGGIFLSKDFGNPDFTLVQPSFTFRYRKDDFKMLFGNIDGSLNHQLIEPVYNFEGVITHRQESGVQFVLNKRLYDFDVWVDWQNAIYNYSNEQEKIWGGVSANVLKLRGEKVELKLPFQMTVYHEGGQIDTTKMGLTKNMNYAPGLVLSYYPSGGAIQRFVADGRYVIRTNNYEDSVAHRSQGSGVMANIGFSTRKNFDVLLSYWYGDDFYNDMGGFLYSSRSRTVAYSSYYSERYRSLLILRLTKRITLPGRVALTLRAEPHYDLIKNIFEYSFGVYIRVDEKFWLGK